MRRPSAGRFGSAGSRGLRIVSVALVALTAFAASAGAAGAAPKQNKGARRVAHAASAFGKQDSARISGSIDIEFVAGSDAGKSISMPFSGEIDNRTKAGRMSFDLSQVPGGSGSLDEIMTNGAVYVSIGSLSPKLADVLGGKHWVEFDTKDFALGGSQPQQSDPTSVVDGLRGVSNDVREEGHESVDGVDTTHYHATMDLTKAAERLPAAQRARLRAAFSSLDDRTVPFDVWVDADGLPRKIEMTVPITAGGESARMTESFRISDYGGSVVVQPPPASDVARYSELQQLEQHQQTTRAA
jgi:hypothetical protein